MRQGVALLALAGALAGCRESGEEVVQGFNGHPWGVPAPEIPELAGKEPEGERDGLTFYTAEGSFLGRQALASFYFHPRTGGLVEGHYVLPLALEECDGEWDRIRQELAAAYSGLMVEEARPRRPGGSSPYASDCEYFVFNAHREEWRATFTNPERPHDRAGLWMRAVGRSARLTVFYRSGAAQAWLDGAGRRWRWRWQRPSFPSFPPAVPPPAPPEEERLPFGRA